MKWKYIAEVYIGSEVESDSEVEVLEIVHACSSSRCCFC